MKELSFLAIISVFQEMLGPLLWLLLAIIIFGTITFITLLIFEKELKSTRLMRSEAGGIIGGVLALVIMAQVSSSGFTDVGGPVDWFLIASIFGLGFVGATILLYTVAGWYKALTVKNRNL